MFERLRRLLWGALAVGARGALALSPPSRVQRSAICRLREEFASIPDLPYEGEASPAARLWAEHRRKLRKYVFARDPRAFLTWDVLTETMFTRYGRFALEELRFLRGHDWSIWRDAIRERRLGLPFPCLWYPFSSSTAVHHAYHIGKFEVETGSRIRDFHEIVEFGGGYGSLCRIVRNAGFTGKYLIFDTPEQCALQRYYLSSLGIDAAPLSRLEALERELRPTRGGGRLFIATWSLSEAPVKLRKRIAGLVAGFDAFLIAYQERFGEIDNSAFFEEWPGWFPGVNWRRAPIQQLPGSSYLFGIAPGADLSHNFRR